MDEMSEAIRTERLALIDLLETLTSQEWATQSLCAAWTVQEVAAHLAWAPAIGIGETLVGLGRSGFGINRFIAASAKRWSQRGQEAIIGQLRADAATGARQIGMPQTAALADAIVHGLDIRRPLHRERPIALQAFTPVADFFIETRWPKTSVVGGSARKRIDGVSLVADDIGWTHGHGPEVHATAEVLMLVLAGRQVGERELSGPGADRLRARL